MNMKSRPRRNRRTETLRQALAETDLSARQLVYPLFVAEDPSLKQEIRSLPGQYRWGTRSAIETAREAWTMGIRSFAIFPVVPESQKNREASVALDQNHFSVRFYRDFKNALPDSNLISDIALDPFNSEGHDGLVRDGRVLNDETVTALAKMAVLHAEAGVDHVAPSDMMDGRVGAIRAALDEKGLHDTGIISYAAKYASSFYGPFREALDSAPRFGDKKTYQMDPRNVREALREVRLDVEEGADVVMVKPALAYLDVIRAVKEISEVPVAAYNVSGEYAMIKFAAQAGALDEKKAALESLTAIRRAGADMIFTYWALDAVRWM